MRNITLILLVFLSLAFTTDAGAQEDQIYIIPVSDAIGPGVADFIKKGIAKATVDRAACIVIELNTPGGLVESMRIIVMAIYGSKIPVVVYVAPSGARAASAGVMITMAADIAAMAPGTNIGAAHPVGAGGKEIGGTMSEKVTNDMVAYVKSIAAKRGRNVEWAEKAVRESASVTATEALKENIIDVIAKDVDDLLAQIEGRNIEGKGALRFDKTKKIILRENIRTKILKIISNPNIAYILMMIGMAGLYFELSNPGAIFPGVIGGISIILAFFAFQTLPVNYAGFLLIFLALVFFIMEMKITSYGLLSIAGTVSLFLGSLMLFEDSTGLRLSWRVLLPTLVMVSGFFAVVAGLVFRSQVSKPKTGASGLMGEIGVVKKRIAPDGKVFVHGELWNAVAADPIPNGMTVRVIGIKNLVLEVEPMSDNIKP
ncbi:MAG: nodulation protein NfeD [Desulfobacterales bacterium]